MWEFHPANQTLRLIFESPGSEVLDKPDNITVSPRGGLVLCEDGDIKPQRMHGLTTDGRLFYDADGSGAQAKVHFATLNAGLALDHLDFLVI